MSVLDGVTPAIVGAANAAGGDSEIERSLRFNTGDSAYLNRTPSSASADRTIWTLSFWIKICEFSLNKQVFTVYSDGSNDSVIRINGNNYLEIYNYRSGSYQTQYISNAQFRDPSAWYHFVVSANGSTSLNAWVNGEAVTWSTSSGPNGVAWLFNNTGNHQIGRYNTNANSNFYLAEVNWIDSQALAETDFGEYDDNNVWQPKAYSGSYGTNGFYLKFADNSSNAALGTDSSGNTNTWTVNNLNANGGEITVANATDALPILNTTGDQGENVGSGTRSDSDGSSIVVAVPLNGSNGGTTITDYHQDIKGSGSAKTISIYTGTAGGATTSTAVSRYYGSSFYVIRGGTNDYTASSYIYRTGDTDFDFGTGDFCVEFWYYPQSMVTNSVIFDNRHPTTNWPSSSNGFALIHNAGGSIFSYSGGNQIIAHASVLTANKWNHIAYTRDQGTERLFVNGNFFTTTASSSRNYNEGRFHLGSAANNGEGTTGYYQDFRMYKGIPKYTSNFTVPTLGDGPAIDSMIDSPTNYTADSGNNGGNYCSLNPLDRQSTNGTLSNGNLDIKQTTTQWAFYRSTMFVSSGKWYWECTLGNNQYSTVGICTDAWSMASATNAWANEDTSMYGYYIYNGNKYNGGAGVSYASADTSAAGSVIGVALDMDNGTLTFYKDGTSLGTAYTGLTGKNVSPTHWLYNQTNADSYNFGQRSFKHTPPANHLSLCTQNLGNPAVADGSTAMDVLLYDGTNNIGHSVTGLSFAPSFCWIKCRSDASTDHVLGNKIDEGSHLASNTTGAEGTGLIQSLDSGGFSLASNSGRTNQSGRTYIGWCWDGGTSTVTNTDGTVTSQVRVNQTAGFSIVSYTGTETNGDSVGHGLSATPEFFILKSRDGARDWLAYNTVIDGSLDFLVLNTTAGKLNSNANDPTSSVFYLYGTDANALNEDYIAYCWTPVEGFSAFGSYTGNGSADGPFIYTGFAPRWVLFKRTDTSGDSWTIFDTARDINPLNVGLEPNSSAAEQTYGNRQIDTKGNGFRVTSSGSSSNANNGIYVYAAFAEHPFKTSRGQ